MAGKQDRLSFILEDTGLSVVLAQAHIVANLPPHQAQVVVMDSDWDTIATQPKDNPSVESNIDNLAYVAYTSGSTGRPKGVMACHRGAINRFYWMWRTYPYTEGDVNCQKTSLNFVDSVWENFGALLRGVPTVVIPDDVGKDPCAVDPDVEPKSCHTHHAGSVIATGDARFRTDCDAARTEILDYQRRGIAS